MGTYHWVWTCCSELYPLLQFLPLANQSNQDPYLLDLLTQEIRSSRSTWRTTSQPGLGPALLPFPRISDLGLVSIFCLVSSCLGPDSSRPDLTYFWPLSPQAPFIRLNSPLLVCLLVNPAQFDAALLSAWRRAPLGSVRRRPLEFALASKLPTPRFRLHRVPGPPYGRYRLIRSSDPKFALAFPLLNCSATLSSKG